MKLAQDDGKYLVEDGGTWCSDDRHVDTCLSQLKDTGSIRHEHQCGELVHRKSMIDSKSRCP